MGIIKLSISKQVKEGQQNKLYQILGGYGGESLEDFKEYIRTEIKSLDKDIKNINKKLERETKF